MTTSIQHQAKVRVLCSEPAPDDPTLTASFDLILNGLEITTGGLRIHELGQKNMHEAADFPRGRMRLTP